MSRIFIGFDSRIPIASEVLIYTLKKHSSIPLDIKLLKKSELNFTRTDPLASTEFAYTRFLVPSLCNYNGIALFMDNDMVCFSDIAELFAMNMTDYAVRVVKHNYLPTNITKMDGKIQTAYPRKNWSSVMLMDCSKLQCWTREAVETKSAAWLHRFEPLSDKLIGDLDIAWNTLDDNLCEHTKLWHMTSGGPYFKECENSPNAAIWYKARDEMISFTNKIVE